MKITKKLILLTAFVAMAGAVGAQTRTIKTQGIEMVETMNDDGTDMIKRPYRWFAGMAEADVESVAVEMAQLEAYAAISRVINNAVEATAERSSFAVNGEVKKALKSHWEQVSNSIQHACEPFGEAESTFNRQTGMYEVIAKVGIRGDRYMKLLNGAKETTPQGLAGSELQQFINANQAIIDAAKGN